jgi:F-type H+-transporting ATPase subunit delta
MLRRFATSSAARRLYSSTASRWNEAGAEATDLILNFCTPHKSIYENKVVNLVEIPSEDGDTGIMAGHVPLIAQLKPGIVTITHTEVSSLI